MIVRAYSFRFPVAIDTLIGQGELERVLGTLPIGDGIVFRGVRGLFEGGKLLQVELEIGDPVTVDRIDLGRRRLEELLGKTLAMIPQQTGLDARAPDELFAQELNKITSSSGGGGWGDFLADLKLAGVLAVAGAVLLAVLLVRR